MLAVHPGQLVTASQLIDGLWPQEMPGAAGNALQALVSRLRRALPEAVIEARPSGYQLNIDPRSTDIVRAGANSEVDPVQCDGIAEPLDQPFGNY